MFKAILVAIFLSFLSLSASASSIKEIGDATYIILVDGEANCSGTLVTKSKILTAAHCILEGDHQYAIQLDVTKDYTILSSTRLYMKVDKIDRSLDVATLSLLDENSGYTFVPVTIATPKEAAAVLEFGTKVISVGYPLNRGELITEGYYASKVFTKDGDLDGEFYKTSVNIMPGSSGGGLYVEIDGTWKLIGTTYAIDQFNLGLQLTPVPFMSYFSTIESVSKVL